MFYSNSAALNQFLESFLTQRMSSPVWMSSTELISPDEKDYEINYTKDGAYLIYEVPGFNKTNLKIELDNDHLTVEGKRTYKLNGEDVIKKISKKFKVGMNYDSSQLEATVEDGILSVFVPNLQKKEKKQIKLL